MDVLITGAFGTAGTALLDRLSGDDYTITCLDRDPAPAEYDEYPSTVADVANYDAIRPHFDDQDAVVHLAGCPGVDCSWEDVLHSNIEGTYAVLDAARDAGVGDFVFASSAHAVGLHESDHAPELYSRDYELTIDASDPVRPNSFYAVSKLFGEHLGRYYAEARTGPERFYALRIAGLRSEEYDHPYGDAQRGVDTGQWERDSDAYDRMAARLHALWISRRDFAQLVDRCLADRSVTFDVFFGVSDNERCWYDVDYTTETLGFDPRDSADEWENPPADSGR